MGGRAPEFSGNTGCLRHRLKEKKLSGQSFSINGGICSSYINSYFIDHKKNPERSVALFLEILCLPCCNRSSSSVGHVPIPGQVKRTRSKIKIYLFYWVPIVFYSAIIFWLSSRTAVLEMPGHLDKILHFIEYFIFAFLLWRAIARECFWSFKARTAIGVALIASAYGASDEFHQMFVPGRSASIRDWFADVAGILGMLTLVLSRVKWRVEAIKNNYETI